MSSRQNFWTENIGLWRIPAYDTLLSCFHEASSGECYRPGESAWGWFIEAELWILFLCLMDQGPNAVAQGARHL